MIPKKVKIIEIPETKVTVIKRHVYQHRNKYAVLGGVSLGMLAYKLLSGEEKVEEVIKRRISINSPISYHVTAIIRDSTILLGSQEKHTP